MITNSSKVTHKADLGLFPTLRKFSKSLERNQFARSILKTPYLSIHANLAFVPIDKVVELSWNSNFVNCIIFYLGLVWELFVAKVALSVGRHFSESKPSSPSWMARAPSVRQMSSVRRRWSRSSAPSARMTSTATPRAEWTRPLSLSSPSRACKPAAASSVSRAHSGELVCARRCVSVHQTSPKAPP